VAVRQRPVSAVPGPPQKLKAASSRRLETPPRRRPQLEEVLPWVRAPAMKLSLLHTSYGSGWRSWRPADGSGGSSSAIVAEAKTMGGRCR
jgi:hypothetical protein